MERRMGVSTKIWLIALSFAIPIIVMTYLFIGTRKEAIDFAEQEMRGNRIQRPLESLLDSIEQQRLLVQACQAKASPACADGIRELTSTITGNLGQFNEVYKDVAEVLQFTPEGLAIRKREFATESHLHEAWKSTEMHLADLASFKDRAGADMAYDNLLNIVNAMIAHQGDTSNLILDPDLDSYYSMDVTLLALPQTQNRLSKVIAYGRDAIEKGALSSENRVQLAVFASMLAEADVARVAGSTNTAMNEDPNFYGASPTLRGSVAPALERYEELNNKFVEMVKKLADAQKPSISSKEFVEAGLAARNESFRFWNVYSAELDKLLEVRIASYVEKRNSALAASAIAVFVALLLSMVAMWSINKPLSKLAANLGPGATLLSTCVKRISQSNEKGASPEENAMIVEELEAHATDMRKAVGELVSIVNGSSAGSQPWAS
jgi:hypothetical protein